MMIGFPILFEIPLVAPGGDGEGVFQVQDARNGVLLAGPGRVLLGEDRLGDIITKAVVTYRTL